MLPTIIEILTVIIVIIKSKLKKFFLNMNILNNLAASLFIQILKELSKIKKIPSILRRKSKFDATNPLIRHKILRTNRREMHVVLYYVSNAPMNLGSQAFVPAMTFDARAWLWYLIHAWSFWSSFVSLYFYIPCKLNS